MPNCESFDALEIHLPMAIRVSDTGLVFGDAVGSQLVVSCCFWCTYCTGKVVCIHIY